MMCIKMCSKTKIDFDMTSLSLNMIRYLAFDKTHEMAQTLITFHDRVYSVPDVTLSNVTIRIIVQSSTDL